MSVSMVVQCYLSNHKLDLFGPTTFRIICNSIYFIKFNGV